MFRDLREPEIIIYDDRIKEKQLEHRPPEGWRIIVKDFEMS